MASRPDYWQAITGARNALADKAGRATDHCQALVWLTDGQYDLDLRHSNAEAAKYGDTKPYGPRVKLDSSANVSKVQSAGVRDLCRAGGVADQLRVSGVVTLAVGLGEDPSSFGLMKLIATGSNGSPCGRRPAQSPGVFVPADGVGQLLLAFDALSDPIHPATTQSFRLCRSASSCREDTQTFILDSPITEVKLLAATSGSARYSVFLEGPSGRQIQIRAGKDDSSSLPGAKITATWESASTVQLDLSRLADQGWLGAWHVAFVDPENAGDTITTNCGSTATCVRLSKTLRASSCCPVTAPGSGLGLARRGGSVIDPASVSSTVTLDAQLVDSAGETTDIATGLSAPQLVKPVEVDLADVPPGPARIVLRLQLTTSAPSGERGTELQPQRVDVRSRSRPPRIFPRSPARSLSTRPTSPATTGQTLPVSGDGCVWLSGTHSLTVPRASTA